MCASACVIVWGNTGRQRRFSDGGEVLEVCGAAGCGLSVRSTIQHYSALFSTIQHYSALLSAAWSPWPGPHGLVSMGGAAIQLAEHCSVFARWRAFECKDRSRGQEKERMPPVAANAQLDACPNMPEHAFRRAPCTHSAHAPTMCGCLWS